MDVESTFQASYERLIGSGVGITDKGQDFFKRFYDRFISRSDLVSEKFSETDMDRQVAMLQKAMFQLISFYLTKSDNTMLQNIAVSHSRARHDIPAELYDLWLESLLDTVRELDPEYDEELRLAWQIVMTPGILYMKHHYNRPPRGRSASE